MHHSHNVRWANSLQGDAVLMLTIVCPSLCVFAPVRLVELPWTTPHCGAVVEDKYIPLLLHHLLLLSLSPQHPDWPRLVIAGSGSGKSPHKTDELENHRLPLFSFLYFLYRGVGL